MASQSGYVMGFVAAVPAANRSVYLAHAEQSEPLFKRLGVTRMVEAWGDDVPRGKATDFYRAVDAREGEVVVYAFQEYPDKATADAADKAMMDDPEMAAIGETMPFDGKRMIYGGFSVIYDKGTGGRAGYVDGSVIAVPREKQAEYRKAYGALSDLILEHGASRVLDGWEDAVPRGEVTDFHRAVAARDDEAIVFSLVEWPDRATRDTAWQKLYADPAMQQGGGIFDEGRRIFGGFVPILDV